MPMWFAGYWVEYLCWCERRYDDGRSMARSPWSPWGHQRRSFTGGGIWSKDLPRNSKECMRQRHTMMAHMVPSCELHDNYLEGYSNVNPPNEGYNFQGSASILSLAIGVTFGVRNLSSSCWPEYVFDHNYSITAGHTSTMKKQQRLYCFLVYDITQHPIRIWFFIGFL